MSVRRTPAARFRVGQVSCYLHHGSWWIYYRQAGRAIRRRAGTDVKSAVAAAEMASGQSALATSTVAVSTLPSPWRSVVEQRRQFLEYHEHVRAAWGATLWTLLARFCA